MKKRIFNPNIPNWKKVISLFILIFSLFIVNLAFVYGQQECKRNNTPYFYLPSGFELNEGEFFIYDVNLSQDIDSGALFSLVPINLSLKNFQIDTSTGIMSYTPKEEDIGDYSFFIIATTAEGCFEMKKAVLRIYDRPKITESFPSQQTLEINETEYIKFGINATTKQKDNKLYYEWYHNNKKIKADSNYFLFLTNFSDSGRHIIEAVVKDSRGLNSSFEWEVLVKNKNRPPYIKYILPNLILTKESPEDILNLNNYIYDPDTDKLFFEVFLVDHYNLSSVINESLLFNITINSNGDLRVIKKMEVYLQEFLKVKATDSENRSVFSPPFFIRLASKDENLSFLFSPYQENKQCNVDIRCGDWSECLPMNIKTRDCFDFNKCNGDNKTILESEDCEYNATCFDNIKNQDEQEVDCGGSCSPCPACDDESMNGGEEGIDCGGSCSPCPSCFDSIKNQDETDIDCGGSCEPCNAGMICASHKDCNSFNCINSTCMISTCYDFRKNQGEEGIDCGGPCKACPTCNDKIKNQGEEGIDCGGPCKKCLSCQDGIKNQGEFFTDCGGPCEPCKIFSFIMTAKNYFLILVLVITILIIFFIFRANYQKDKIGILIDLSRILLFLPKKLPEDTSGRFIKTINKLQEVKQELFNIDEKEKIKSDFTNSIDELFRYLFEIEGSFSLSELQSSIASKFVNPFLRYLFLEVYKESQNISSESPLFKIEMSEKIDQTIRMLNKIREII